MLDLKGRSLDTKGIDAARWVRDADAHATAMRNQDLAENNAVVPIKLSDHGRIFFTNWMEPSNL
jgi:hypothetical protein